MWGHPRVQRLGAVSGNGALGQDWTRDRNWAVTPGDRLRLARPFNRPDKGLSEIYTRRQSRVWQLRLLSGFGPMDHESLGALRRSCIVPAAERRLPRVSCVSTDMTILITAKRRDSNAPPTRRLLTVNPGAYDQGPE